jgi:selenocysteine lyase/cysteine desulfurase
MLERHTFSNPHSRNPSSLAAEAEIVAARNRVLAFFNASADEYTVVWTR